MHTLNRITIEALDGVGRALTVEVTIHDESVEVHATHRCRAVFERDLLRDWLAAGYRPLAGQEVTWGHTPSGVAIDVADVVPWFVLSPGDLHRLYQAL